MFHKIFFFVDHQSVCPYELVDVDVCMTLCVCICAQASECLGAEIASISAIKSKKNSQLTVLFCMQSKRGNFTIQTQRERETDTYDSATLHERKGNVFL